MFVEGYHVQTAAINQSFKQHYAAGALSLTEAGAAGAAAGAGGTAELELTEPASRVVPHELQPDEIGAATYELIVPDIAAPQPQAGAAGAAQPQAGAAGAAQPQDGAAGAAQPQDGAAGAAQPQDGAGAGAQHVGSGAGQHEGAGAQQELAAFLA